MRIVLAALLLAGSAAVAQIGESTQLEGPFNRADYPLALGDRPLVLPHLMVEGTPWFEFTRLSPSVNRSDLGLRAGIGIADRFQVDAITNFAVDPQQEWNKTLTGELRVLAFDSRDLDVAGLVSLPFDLAEGHDRFTGGTVGASTRFRVNRYLYLYGLRDLAEFGTKDEFSLGLNGSVGVGIEPIRHVSLELQTTIVHLGVTGAIESTRWFGADYVPAQGLLNLAINRNFDVLAGLLLPDLKNGFDSMAFVGGINARL